MCCSAEWKREIVPDHKFDFVNIREFHRTDFWTRFKYIWRYIFLLKSFAVYGLDIFTAVTMISSDHWTNTIGRRCGDNCAVPVQFGIAKWIFVGCIIFSFVLLGYETWKAKQVIDSRDISYAFTNLLANDYYSFKNYDNFCLFCHIDSSTKKKDDFAFFIFFTFKGWKRLLLADGPRQSINALVLYSFAYSFGFQTHNIPAYWDNSLVTAMLLWSMILTVLIFAGSLILLIAAAVLYVPLLCYIQGNLKEYVCHKVDKRIAEVIKKKQRQRVARQEALERKMANGGVKNSKGDVVTGVIPQPTLPDIAISDKELLRAKSKAGSRKRSAQDWERDDVPPMQNDGYGGYPPRSEYDSPYQIGGAGYQEDYGSSTNLAAHAAPLGLAYPPAVAPPQLTSYPYPGQSYNRSGPYRPVSPLPTSRSGHNLNLSTTYGQSYDRSGDAVPPYQAGILPPQPQSYSQSQPQPRRQLTYESYASNQSYSDGDSGRLAYDLPQSHNGAVRPGQVPHDSQAGYSINRGISPNNYGTCAQGQGYNGQGRH